MLRLGPAAFRRCLSFVCFFVPLIACDVPGPSQEVRRELIAFGECDASGRSQIFVADLEGKNKVQLTSTQTSWFPAWSPDGNRIAYTSEGQQGMQIWVMDRDARNQRQLTIGGTSLAPSWSPDGQKIAYAHSEGPPSALKIWIMNFDGSGRHRLIPETEPGIDENVPRWSPDGGGIVFTSNRREGRYEIWVVDAPGGKNLRRLTTAYYDETLSALIEQKVPAWSPDGTKIAYWCGVEATDRRPNLPRNVWVTNSDGSNQRLLISGDDPNWSPDSKTIIYSTGQYGVPALGVIGPDGSNPRILFNVRACRPLQSSWGRVANS